MVGHDAVTHRCSRSQQLRMRAGAEDLALDRAETIDNASERNNSRCRMCRSKTSSSESPSYASVHLVQDCQQLHYTPQLIHELTIPLVAWCSLTKG